MLYIFTDDQSRRTVSCYGQAHDWVRTPHIDALAAEGVRFESAYIGTWCMPSRATQLTGLRQYNVQTMRATEPYPNAEYDPARCPFWFRCLRDGGYVTAQIGKWHTGADAGWGRDWDLQAVWNRPNLRGDDVWAYYDNPKLEVNGAEAEVFEGYSTDIYTGLAERFIRERRIGQGSADFEQPWLLWLCYSGVHGPYTPAERHAGRYAGTHTPPPVDIFPPRPDKPPHMRLLTRWTRSEAGDPVSFQEAVRQYHEAVLSIDEGVGRLVESLRQTGQLDNTLIVFTSDQGFAWGQHGLEEKWAPYDAALCAPLIFRLPGRVAQGRVCDAPVGGDDLAATLIAQTGAKVPWRLDGHDFSRLLSDPESEWPHPVLLAQTHDIYGDDLDPLPPTERRVRKQLPWYVLCREGRYKHIRYLVPGEGEELYDLAADPAELENLVGHASHAEVLERMRDVARTELSRTGPEFLEAVGW
ncbi:MAG: sulfatase-like hydrolase/transferase [Botrimarina sp.]